MYILDTDHVSILERKVGSEAERLRFRLSHRGKTTTIITYEEQMRGWLSYIAQARSLPQQIERYRKLNQMLDHYREITVLNFDEPAVREFEHLQRLRVRIGTMDLKIAAIALAHNATLLSRNLKDFRKVPGLQVEDWSG
jgi:tRNA(fMet)-specific endonuclease VapC